jgi:3-deoxy-D-manno-octulosonate 8-phosphate phosphatase (KDO 8-P phosphatase)
MSVVIVIPSRYASTRLPGKPLIDICGKPMIQHVWEKARRIVSADRIIVATDDRRIYDTVMSFGGEALMTSDRHETGSDRLIEVASYIEGSLFINIQGDEPLIRPADIEQLITVMTHNPDIAVGTLCHEVSTLAALNPHSVKVVLDADDNALYFSRALIPYPQNPAVAGLTYYQHIGVYGYRRDVLLAYNAIPQPMLEKTEKLEQLRLLHSGYKIRVIRVESTGPGVDTQEGLEVVRGLLAGSGDVDAEAK